MSMPMAPSEPQGVAADANIGGTTGALADAVTGSVKSTMTQLGVPGIVWGVVSAVSAGPPVTCSLSIQGSTTVLSGVQTLNDFVPSVGQTVVCVQKDTDLFVLGGVSSGGGATDIGVVGYFEKAPVAGWLLCDGSTFSATAYPALYAFRGSNVLPDLRGRFIIGAGGSYSSGAQGGASTVILAVSNLPTGTIGSIASGSSTGTESVQHFHEASGALSFWAGVAGSGTEAPATVASGYGNMTNVTNTTGESSSHTHTVPSLSVSSSGSNASFSILPPYYALYAYMKAA